MLELDRLLSLLLALASIVAAEAPRYQCDLEARTAVVHVAMNRLAQPWVHEVTQGWQTRPPVAEDVRDTLLALAQPDITAGALFLFGPGDVSGLRRRNNGQLPWWLQRYAPFRRWNCRGTYVEAWTLDQEATGEIKMSERWKLAVVQMTKFCGQTPLEAALSFVREEYGPDASVELSLLEGDHALADLGVYLMTVKADDQEVEYLLSPPWAALRLSGCYRILEFSLEQDHDSKTP